MSEENIKDISKDVFLVINDVWADLIKDRIKTHETRSAYIKTDHEMKKLFGENGNNTTKMSIVKWDDTELKAGPKTIKLNENAKMENNENYETYDGEPKSAWTNMIDKDGNNDRRIMTNFSDNTESKVYDWSIIGTAEMSCETITGMENFFRRAEDTLCPLPGNDFEISKDYKDYIVCHNAIMKLKEKDNMPKYEEILNKIPEDYKEHWKTAWKTWYYKLISGLESYKKLDDNIVELEERYLKYFEEKENQLIEMKNVDKIETLDKTKLYPQFYKGFHSTIDYKNENGKTKASGGKMRKSRRRRRRGRSTRRRKSSRKSRRRRKA